MVDFTFLYGVNGGGGRTMDILKLFGSNLRKYRENLGLPQEKFAETCGLHRTYISDIERFQRSISLSNIQKIADALGIETYRLFMEEKMNLTVIDYRLPSSDRQTMRKTLISIMLDEMPGNGTGDLSRHYQYNVESYGKYGIFLKRPTRLNKGFDFTVNTKGIWFKKNRRYSNPTHQDIINALRECKSNNPDEYESVKCKLTSIYYCEDIDTSLPLNLSFSDYEGSQHPIEVIILAVKWLFIEQDCTYWNYSGRAMFYSELEKNYLV